MPPRKVPYEKSLAALRPDIAEFYSVDNEIPPTEIGTTSGYKTKFDFVVEETGFKYSVFRFVQVFTRQEKFTPPHLSRRQEFIPGFNDMKTKHEDLLDIFVSDHEGETNPELVFAHTNKLFWWRCAICSQNYQQKLVMKINVGRGCPYCSRQKIGNSTETLGKKFPEIYNIWSKRNEKSPDDYFPRTSHKFWLVCPNHLDVPYEISGANYSSGSRCGYCASKKVFSNSPKTLTYRFPDIAKEYSNKNKVPVDMVLCSSNEKVIWDYSCGHSGVQAVDKRTRRENYGCKICSQGFNKSDLIKLLTSISQIYSNMSASVKISILSSLGVSIKNYNNGTAQELRKTLSGEKTLSEVLQKWEKEESDEISYGEDSPTEEGFTSGLEGLEEDDSDILLGVGGAEALVAEDELDAQIHGIGEALNKGRTGVGKADELVEFLISSFVAEKWKAEFAK